MERSTTWSIVKFLTDDSVSVVPTKWINNNECFWPPLTSDKVSQAIKQQTLNTCWPTHKISVFRNATYNNYETARIKARRAEETNDLNSDEDSTSCKKRRIIQRKLSSSDNDINKRARVYIKASPRFNKNPAGSLDVVSDVLAEKIRAKEAADKVTPVKANENSAGCICCPHALKHFEEILRQQQLIRTMLTDVAQKIEHIRVPNEVIKQEEVSSVFENFYLPLQTEEELTDLNEVLSHKENYNKAVTEMSKIGGSSPYDFVRRVLTTLISNELASRYSWLGRRQKAAFSNLPIAQLVIDSGSRAGKSPDRKKIEEAISQWLRRAKERR